LVECELRIIADVILGAERGQIFVSRFLFALDRLSENDTSIGTHNPMLCAFLERRLPDINETIYKTGREGNA
jgi:hypothetical protein